MIDSIKHWCKWWCNNAKGAIGYNSYPKSYVFTKRFAFLILNANIVVYSVPTSAMLDWRDSWVILCLLAFSSSQSTSLGSEKPVLQLLPCSDCEGAGIDGHGCMVNKALEPLRRALKSCKDRAMVALVGPCKFGSWKWNDEAAVHGPVGKCNYPSSQYDL